MLTLNDSPLFGMDASPLVTAMLHVDETNSEIERTASGSPAPDLLGRIVGMVERNELLFARRDALRTQLARVRAYLIDPAANTRLALAQIHHLKLKHSAVMVQLRANRLEGQSLLAALDAGASGAS